MYVCICHAVTDEQIREEVCNGACSLRAVSKRLGVASRCGKCKNSACQVIKETIEDNNTLSYTAIQVTA